MSKFVYGLMFSFLFISLFFWWFSLSSSLSLLMVLVFSVISTLSFSFFLEFKVPLFMVVLTLSGGLFVLVSFVIMFFPDDYKFGVTYAKKIFYSCLLMMMLGMSMSFFRSGDLLSGEGLVVGGFKVWGSFIMVYFFFILLLFLFLFVVNSVVNLSTGSMFSDKKKAKLKK
uniref:NADH dehydrogenase subunit 6 n=1 Tax=Campanulotes compar TaxID=135595 RepID=A0A386JNB5_9NEOP|nr:NADH dehydrogenase subunit 6 [Campanulotes compar]AYD72940.1 NADH dehydrogenase subunit 6 [Campanulotes compar]